MKELNEGLQMRSDWTLPICSGRERLKVNGQKAHPTQKPEALLYRVILSSSNSGDLVLDPFFGTGTTGAVARRLHRHFIGIERHEFYVELARERIASIAQLEFDPAVFCTFNPRKQARIPFGTLVEYGFLEPGQFLSYGASPETAQRQDHVARVLVDGAIEYQGQRGSIHQIARQIRNGPANGWDLWCYLDEPTGQWQPIDTLRRAFREAGQVEIATPPEDDARGGA
jgi:modification methylase